MELMRGLVVKAVSGRDKDGFFVVLSSNSGYAVICDGKRRSLEKPKQKNIKHLLATQTVLQENSMETNREIRRALSSFNK